MLIILTPHIVRNPEDAERVRQMEESRMNWCLCDVNQVHGPAGFSAKTEPQACAGDLSGREPPRHLRAPPTGPSGPPPGTPLPSGPPPGGPQPLRDGRPEPLPPGPEMPAAKTSALTPIDNPALKRLPTADSVQLTNYQPPSP